MKSSLPEEAISLLTTALRIQDSVLMKNHPDMARTHGYLGVRKSLLRVKKKNTYHRFLVFVFLWFVDGLF
jgi:hypothetical protein